ncbi:MAG: hypothetical protein ACKOAS_09500 [Verrucomicrobiota bacterium]
MTNEQIPTTRTRRKPMRGKLNLTIHPEIKEFAVALANARRDTVSQLFEDLVEAEWNRIHGIVSTYPPPRAYMLSRHSAPASPSNPPLA